MKRNLLFLVVLLTFSVTAAWAQQAQSVSNPNNKRVSPFVLYDDFSGPLIDAAQVQPPAQGAPVAVETNNAAPTPSQVPAPASAEEASTAPVTSTPSSNPLAHEWWVTAGKQAFVVNEQTSKPLAVFEFGENARYREVSPDGTLIAIASDGSVKIHLTFGGVLEHWPNKGSHSSITLVKKPGYEMAGHFDVPFRPHFIRFTSDNARLAVVSQGQVSNSKDKHIAPQIVLLDLPGGKVRKQVELASAPLTPWFIPEDNRLIVPCLGMDKRPDAPPELIVFDTLNGEVHKDSLTSVPYGWEKTDSKDRRYLITSSVVMILDASGGTVGKPVEAGGETALFVPAPHAKRYYLAGNTNDHGRLTIIEEDRVVKTLETIPASDLFVDEKKSQLILCGNKEGMILDAETLTEQGRLPMPGSIVEAKLTPDGTRLYVVDQGFHIVVIDLTTRQQVARVSAGRGGVRFLQNFVVPAVMAFGAAGSILATGTPGAYPGLLISGPVAHPVQSLALSPKGDFLYAYNPKTNDITMVKTADYTVVRQVALGPTPGNGNDAFRFRTVPWLSPDGRYLTTCELDKVVVIDTEKAEVIGDKKFKGNKPSYQPSLNLIFVQGAEGTQALRPASLGLFKDLKPSGEFDLKALGEGVAKKSHGEFQPPEDLIVVPNDRRVFLFSPAGLRMFDYDLNPVAQVAGISNLGGVYVLP
ncbi:MAG TPA: hypothetical protein VNM47_07150 [Terriglobia bacterium]|nr:hypothetical protein [Terriglobia bacterium]